MTDITIDRKRTTAIITCPSRQERIKMPSKIEKLEQKIAALRLAARAEKRAAREAEDRELLTLIRRAKAADQVRELCCARLAGVGRDEP